MSTAVFKVADAGTTIDRAAILRLVDNDLALLHEIVTIFLEEVPGVMAEIRMAVRQQDAAKLQMNAHKLKGSASTFSSPATLAAAQVLEDMGQRADFTQVDAAQSRLESATFHLQQALHALAAELAS